MTPNIALIGMLIEIADADDGIELPPAVDSEIDVGTGGGHSFVRIRVDVRFAAGERETARAVVDGARRARPSSIATRGSTEVVSSSIGNRRGKDST